MVAVIWIDWYSYHVARFRALLEHPAFRNRAAGIELVGEGGVHRGLKFRDAERGNLPIHTLEPGRGWHEAGQPRLARAVWAHLDRLQPEMVLIPGYYTLPGVAAALWARRHGKRSVLMTESGARDQPRSGWKEKLKGWLIRILFDSASTGGREHRDYLIQLGFPPDRIRGYYDTVDNDYFARETAMHRAAASSSDLPLPPDYFLYVGRLAEEKNLRRLLEAFAAYRYAGGAWSLVLAGDGPLLAELQAAAARLGVAGHVVFAGMQATGNLPRYYAFASCFVLPSTREPWGLVVNEAMASGLPVLVSTHCGCAPDLLEEGGNGFLFDPLDVDALAGRMLAVAQLGATERVGMGDRSQEKIARYSPKAWAAEIASLLPARAAQSKRDVEAAA